MIFIGRHIGQFTDEFPKHIILEAVFGGKIFQYPTLGN
jgi:hypothetical protein